MIIDELFEQLMDSLDDEFIVAIEAGRFVDYCVENHHDEFQLWLRMRSEAIVGTELRARLQRQRARARAEAGARAFRDAVDSGDPGVLHTYYATSHKNLWKKLGHMTAADLSFVADRYQANGDRNHTWAQFFRHLALKVPAHKTLGDVFNAEDIGELQKRFLTGHPEPTRP